MPFGVLDQLLRQAGAAVPPGQLEAGARLLDVLNELQSEGPAVVVVDDAQWADEPSLRALLFAVRRLVADRVLVLLVVRDGEGTRLPEGLRKTAGTRLLLDPLAVGELHELAESVGVAISGRGARRLHEHSGGSPLHARALLAEVPARTWEDADATLPAPGSLAELVAARLCACGESSVRLLEAAAVLGQSSPLATAARMAEVDDAFAAVEAPAGIDLVALGQGPLGPELHFTHPLIRAAVYQGLSPLRRARLHAVAAGLVEDEWAVLNHRVAASAGPDGGLATELEGLAERCAGERRWPRACTCLVAAARLSASRADRERRLLAAVEAAMYAGDNPRARALAAETDGLLPTAELNSALAYVAIGDGRHEEAESRLQRAWEACGSDHALAARIAERRAFLAIVRLQGAAAVEWAERSRALRADGQTAWSLALGLYYTGRRAEARALVDEEARRGVPLNSMKGGLLLADDELDAARDAFAGMPHAVTAGSLVIAARALAKQAQLEHAAGRWEETVVLAARATAIADEADEVAAQAVAGWASVLVPAARGDFAACERVLGNLAGLDASFEAHVAAIRLAHAVVAGARRDPAGVIEALAPLLALEQRDAIDDPGHWPWPHLYAGALVELGRLGEAEAFLDRYEQIAADRGARLMRARLARVRAALALARDEHAEAEAAFEAAAEALPAGMPYERALTDFAHGRLLRRAGRRRDAAAHLSAARDTFAALDAGPLLERCTRELDACGLTPIKRGPDADRTRLTPQEQSIARLAATGLSNREIAAELLLSVKTVERHLTHVYRKLGVGSRSELSPDP